MSALVVGADALLQRVRHHDEARALQERFEGAQVCGVCQASLQAVRSMRGQLAKAEARTREAEYMLDAALLLLKR